MMCTLPGLPMFGHGQIEAFTEKYGMEYKRPRYEETPNQHLVERHQREIAPLLKNRHVFAESANFWLFDFWREDGTVDENVFAWSNRAGDQRALVVYHNKYGSTSGTLHGSAAKGDKATGSLRTMKLHEALGLPGDGNPVLAYQDNKNGLHYLRWVKEIRDIGLRLQLHAYQYHVLQNWRVLQPTAEYPWDALCSDLNGHGVWSLDEALDKFKLRPVHAALRRALDADLLRCYADLAETEAETADGKPLARASEAPCGRDETFEALTARAGRFFREAMATLDGGQAHARGSDEPESVAPGANADASQDRVDGAENRYRSAQRKYRELLEAASRVPQLEKQCAQRTLPAEARVVLPSYSPMVSAPAVWSPVAAWCLVTAFAELLPPERNRGEVFDKLYLRSVLAETFHPLGLEGEEGYRAAARVRLLITEEDGAAQQHRVNWDDPDVAWLTGLHEAQGNRWFNKEAHERLVWWRLLPRLVDLAEKDPTGKSPATTRDFRALEAEAQEATRAAEAAGFNLDKLRPSEKAGAAAGDPETEKALDPKADEHEPAGRRR
ncbi:MAG TPA: hypothetical protein VKT75_11660, partial [Acidobacteriaceae bacterium]|nr:hypothetical protein [Acidobacteriaceae bacterium]